MSAAAARALKVPVKGAWHRTAELKVVGRVSFLKVTGGQPANQVCKAVPGTFIPLYFGTDCPNNFETAP